MWWLAIHNLYKIVTSKGSSINDVTICWTFYDIPSLIVMLFSNDAYIMWSQCPSPPPLMAVTSFMDKPLRSWKKDEMVKTVLPFIWSVYFSIQEKFLTWPFLAEVVTSVSLKISLTKFCVW